MRASTIVALALAAVASATPFDLSRRDYPTCADSCLANANLDGCGATDYSCLCQDHTFLDTTTQCIYNACTDPTDLQQAVATASAVCAAAGFPITSTYTPTQSRSATGSGTSTGSSPASTTGSSTGSKTTTGSSTGSKTSSGSTAPTSTPASNTTSSAPTTSTTSKTGGAAARFGSASTGLVAIAAVVAGAFAF